MSIPVALDGLRAALDERPAVTYLLMRRHAEGQKRRPTGSSSRA